MSVEDLYKKACDAVERANYDYAVDLFREVLRQEPEYPDARIALRGTERRRLQERGRSPLGLIGLPVSMLLTGLKGLAGKAPKRLEVYEDFLEKHPSSFWGLKHAAGAAAAAGHTGDAINVYRDALNLKPNDKGSLRALGDLLVSVGQHQEALKCMTKLSSLEPRNRDLQREVRDLAATEHMTAHEMDGATSFRDLIRDKEVAEKLEQDGRMAVSMSDLERQLASELEELKAHPNNVNRILGVAKLLVDTGRIADAQKLLREKHKAVPDSYEIRERLGDAQLLMYAAAVKKAQQALAADPGDETARARKAELEEKRLQFAVKEFTWRLAQHPTDREIEFHLAAYSFEAGRLNEAIAGFQTAAQDSRFETECSRMLGRAFMMKGQSDLALEQFEHAIARHPQLDVQGKELHYSKAQALEELGRTGEALAVYKRIYSTDINFRDVADKVDALSS